MSSCDWNGSSKQNQKKYVQLARVRNGKRMSPDFFKGMFNGGYYCPSSSTVIFINFIIIALVNLVAGSLILSIMCTIGGWSMDGGRPNTAPLAVLIIGLAAPWMIFVCVILIINASRKAEEKHKEEKEHRKRMAEFNERERIRLYRAFGKDPEVIDEEFERFHKERRRKKREMEARLISLNKGREQ